MRLEVACENRPGMARRILDVLSAAQINVQTGEFARERFIYLHTPTMTAKQLQRILPQIRAIDGVHDVHPVALLPGEKRQVEQQTLLDALPGPVLSVDLEGRVLAGNQAAADLLQVQQPQLAGYNLQQAIENLSLEEQIHQLRERPMPIELQIGQQRLQCMLQPIRVPIGKLGYTLTGAVISTRQPLRPALLPSAEQDSFERFQHAREPMRTLIRQAKRMALLDAPLLILGETGTGKQRLARACHQHSARRQGPFVVLDCASLSDQHLEVQLFGMADSTGQMPCPGLLESTEGGTLYLDRVDAMSPLLQQRLVGFLQSNSLRRIGGHQAIQLDTRILAASERNLWDACQQQRFREDLYFRLNTLQLQLPPLRERVSELPGLVSALLEELCQPTGQSAPTVSEDALRHLQHYPWPGNIRELKNQLLNALVRAEGESPLQPWHFDLPRHAQPAELPLIDEHSSWEEAVSRFEARLLAELYPRYPSSRQLGKRLGLSHSAVAKKLKAYGVGTPTGSGDQGFTS